MLQKDPNQRPTIGDILAHPWMQEPDTPMEDVLAEFEDRRDELNLIRQ